MSEARLITQAFLGPTRLTAVEALGSVAIHEHVVDSIDSHKSWHSGDSAGRRAASRMARTSVEKPPASIWTRLVYQQFFDFA